MGKSSPSRGISVKEYREKMKKLQKNFDLKLIVHLLEESDKKGRIFGARIIKSRIELKVDNETLK